MIKNNNYYNKIANDLKRSNDNKYKEILYSKYYCKLLSFINKKFINIPKKVHHDIAIESLLRSFDKIYQYDSDKASYTTWLHTITYNKCKYFLLKESESKTGYLVDPSAFDVIGANKSVTGNIIISIKKN